MSTFAEKLRAQRAAMRAERKRDAIPVVTPSAGAGSPDAAEYARQVETARRQAEQAQRTHAANLAAERSAREKLQREVEAMRANERSAKIRAGVLAAVKAAGAVNDDDAADLILARHKLALGDDGKVTREDDPTLDADATAKAFLAERPHLVRSTVQPGAGAPTFTKPAPNGAPAPTFAQNPTAALRARLNDEIAQSTGAAGTGRERVR